MSFGTFLSVILFFVLTAMTLWHAAGKVKVLRSPFDYNHEMQLTGEEYFVVLIFATALFQCDRLLAIRLLINEFLCIIVMLRCNRNRPYSVPMVLYMVYMIWLIIGCLYAQYPIYGVRAIIKYIYPLLVVIVCSRVVSNAEVAIKAGVLARRIGIIAAIVGTVPVVEGVLLDGVFWYGTARAINFISLMIFSLAMFSLENYDRQKNLLLALFFILPCFLWVFRTSIMGSLVALAMFSLLRYRLRSIPYIAIIGIIGVICVFKIPSLKEKMFFDKDITFEEVQEEGIDDETINTNGRTYIWEYLEHKFYEKNKWLGAGTGSVQQEMYNNSEIYGGLKVPHSDYVQMRCDNGRIGMFLYLLAMIMVIVHCAFVYNNEKNKHIRICAITAGSALAGILATLYSDNTVNYSICTLSFPMGFYGMMLGLIHAEKEKKKQKHLDWKMKSFQGFIDAKVRKGRANAKGGAKDIIK